MRYASKPLLTRGVFEKFHEMHNARVASELQHVNDIYLDQRHSQPCKKSPIGFNYTF